MIQSTISFYAMEFYKQFAAYTTAAVSATATAISATAAATAEYENKDNDPPTTAKSTTVHK